MVNKKEKRPQGSVFRISGFLVVGIPIHSRLQKLQRILYPNLFLRLQILSLQKHPLRLDHDGGGVGSRTDLRPCLVSQQTKDFTLVITPFPRTLHWNSITVIRVTWVQDRLSTWILPRSLHPTCLLILYSFLHFTSTTRDTQFLLITYVSVCS